MGNRVAPAPKKTKKQPAKRRSPAPVILAVVLVLLIAAYCVLCYIAGRGNTLYKDTRINGIDLGGMTQSQAVDALTQGLDGVTSVEGVEYAQLQLDPEIEGVQPYTVDLGAVLGYDIEDAVGQAYAHDRQGMFLVRGWRWLVGQISGGEQYTILPRTMDETAVLDALHDSGILELNTTVETVWELKEETLELTMGVSGYSVDEDALVDQVMERTAQGNFDIISCPLVGSDPAEVDVQKIYDEVYAEAANATLDVAEDNSYTIVESVRGIDFDVAAAKTKVAQAQQGSLVVIDLIREEPAIDTQKLEEGLFRDVLGKYTTSVGGGSVRKNNVRLCGEKMNGTIVLPGEEFSYNEVVGERTVEAGFGEADAYLYGETVKQVGGGVCQGSSTLYCAVLYSNLEIVTRKNHSYPSAYVPLGLDATVSWGGPEFVFKNNTDYPIMVVCSYSNSKLTVEIHGTVVEPFKVKMTTETLATIEPTREEIPDDTLYVGEEVIEDKGHTGYKVQSYRLVYDGDGNLVSKEKEAYSVYLMTKQVVRVGTKPVPEEPEVPDVPSEGAEQTPADGETIQP